MSIFVHGNRSHPIRPHFLVEPRMELEMSPEDFILPLTLSAICKHASHQRPSQCNVGQEVSRPTDSGDFRVTVDVQQFRPEEISVKVVDKSIVLEARHEERQDEHGFVSRQFLRRYELPEGYDIGKVSSSLSSDGVLTLSAPKISPPEVKERVIPVIHTGPHKTQGKNEVANATTEEKKE